MVLIVEIAYNLVIIVKNSITRIIYNIQIHYNNLSIQYRYCLATFHLIQECPTLLRNQRIEIKAQARNLAPLQAHVPSKDNVIPKLQKE